MTTREEYEAADEVLVAALSRNDTLLVQAIINAGADVQAIRRELEKLTGSPRDAEERSPEA
jgi:BMFP domain-containing protein YqiC